MPCLRWWDGEYVIPSVHRVTEDSESVSGIPIPVYAHSNRHKSRKCYAKLNHLFQLNCVQGFTLIMMLELSLNTCSCF